MISQPLVTIGLATCNGAKTIRRSFDSICSQTYKNLEVLISDNASTDETETISREYAAKDPRIRYIRQKENMGATKNYLSLLERARGKYFAWATDDDWYDHRFVESLVMALEENPEHGVAMSSFERRFPDDKLKDRVQLTGDLDLTGRSHAYLFQKMISGFPIHIFFYGLFRRELLRRLVARGFPICIRPDRVFMAEAALATKFVSVKPVLYYKIRSYESPEVRILNDERYNPDVVQAEFQKSFAQTKYLLNLLTWPLSSSAVPASRKLVIPFFWLRFVAKKKGTVAREIYKAISPSSLRKIVWRVKESWIGLKKSLPLLGGNWFMRTIRFIKILGLKRANVRGRLDYDKRRIYMAVSSLMQLKRLRACSKEPATVSWIESVVKPGDVFYDIGANVGAYSFVAWAVSNEKSKIYSFEPGSPTFAALEKNIALNHASNSITPYQVACTEKTGTFTFHYKSRKPGGASHILTQEGGSPYEHFRAAASEKIKGYALDDFISAFRIDPPTHLKIDVDGSEFAVIRGAAGILRSHGLRSILIEVDEKRSDAPELIDRLKRAGFTVHSKHQRGSAGKRVFNYIFVRTKS